MVGVCKRNLFRQAVDLLLCYWPACKIVTSTERTKRQSLWFASRWQPSRPTAVLASQPQPPHQHSHPRPPGHPTTWLPGHSHGHPATRPAGRSHGPATATHKIYPPNGGILCSPNGNLKREGDDLALEFGVCRRTLFVDTPCDGMVLYAFTLFSDKPM